MYIYMNAYLCPTTEQWSPHTANCASQRQEMNLVCIWHLSWAPWRWLTRCSAFLNYCLHVLHRESFSRSDICQWNSVQLGFLRKAWCLSIYLLLISFLLALRPVEATQIGSRCSRMPRSFKFYPQSPHADTTPYLCEGETCHYDRCLHCHEHLLLI